MSTDPTAAKARDLVLAGTELAGAAAAGALGFFAAGPGGAALLGTAGAAITKALTSAADKFMTEREGRRVASVAAIAVGQINDNLKQGRLPRQDLFQTDAGEPSTGEELLEGTLLKARDEYEQRKLPYLAHFYANLIFAPGIAPPVAFMLLKTFEKLTYRQLSLLAIVQQRGVLNVSFLRVQQHTDPEVESLKREEMDLHGSDLGTLGLLTGAGPYDDSLSSLGALLVDLAGLRDIPVSDQDAVVSLTLPSLS